MKRFVVSLCLLCGWQFLAVSAVQAQDTDEVTYLDKNKKELRATGSITDENPGSITLKRTLGTLTIPAGDVVDIIYGLRAKLKLPYLGATNTEKKALAAEEGKRKALILEAIKGYRELLPQMQEYKRAQTHAEYKIARLYARLAEDDPKETEQALAALDQFKQAHANSWQTLHVAKLLAHLQLKQEKWTAAARTYEDLANTPHIDKALKEECEMLGAEVLMKAKEYGEARKKFERLAKVMPADSPQRARIDIYLIQCGQNDPKAGADVEKKLRTLIDKLSDKDTNDRNLKALAYNTLGDYYLSKSRSRDAFWAYMFVDVEYNQDRAEHKKALQALWKLFEEFKDDAKAKQYKERYQKAG
jgi:hypothetical protein